MDLIQVIVDYPYNIPMTKDSKCRFILSKTEDYSKNYIVIVVAQPIISPMNYPLETYLMLKHLLEHYQLTLDDVDVFLDFKERFRNGEFMQWFFKEKEDGNIEDRFSANLKEEDLPEAITKIRKVYL